MLQRLPVAKHVRLCTLGWVVLLFQILLTQRTIMLALAVRMQQDHYTIGELTVQHLTATQHGDCFLLSQQ